MKKRALAIALTALTGGCVTGQKMGDIHEGMSRHEVESTLGNPDGYQRSGEYEALRYTDRLIGGWSWNRTDYTVVLQNGQVIGYGPGQVRQEGPMTPRPSKATRRTAPLEDEADWSVTAVPSIDWNGADRYRSIAVAAFSAARCGWRGMA
jgi:hypothetical protein